MEIESIGYEVKPELPEEGLAMAEKGIAVKMLLKHLHSKGAKHNLSFKDLPMLVNSHKALLLLEYAKDKGMAYEYASEVYRSYFEDHKNIAHDEVLMSISKKVGLNLIETKAALTSQTYEKKLLDTRNQIESLGIKKYPTFVIEDQYTIAGTPSEKKLRAIFDKL